MLNTTSVSAQSTTRILLPNFLVSIPPDSEAAQAITQRQTLRSKREHGLVLSVPLLGLDRHR